MYVVGVDTGGTFTDCVLLDEEGTLVTGKALSTLSSLEVGVLESMATAAAAAGSDLERVLHETRVFCHGTTAGLNELHTRSGARVALLTTRGHEDAMRIGRVFAKVAGLGDLAVTDVGRLAKPVPLVDTSLVIGVDERVDSQGAVVVGLAEPEIERVVDKVAALDVDAVAISLLWSFLNPAHEQALSEALRDRLPGLYLSVSSTLAPVLGEYERTMTAVINSYVGPTLASYLDVLHDKLVERGLAGNALMMQSNGGVFPLAKAAQQAVKVLHSGPVGGVIGATVVGDAIGHRDVVTTDVGGTSFDVSLVVGGEPIFSAEPELDRFAVVTPMIDVRSIGAGGGSIAWIDEEHGGLRVGPASAGSDPGPACYGRGGERPTVTDADLVLGRLDPDRFWGGRLRLDAEAAARAIESHVARPLGMSLEQAASGIVDIADNAMADLVRRMTTERGHDSRDFVLFAFGGGGPVHVGAYGATIGARAAVIPSQAPVFSAVGIACAESKHVARVSDPALMPFDAASTNVLFEQLARSGADTLDSEDVRLSHRYLATMRFRNQTHEVAVPVGDVPLAQDRVPALVDRFVGLYEQIYGRGTALLDTPIEVVTFEVVTTARSLDAPPVQAAVSQNGSGAQRALTGTRQVFFAGRARETNVYDGERLAPGDALSGPAILNLPATTIVVHPDQELVVDRLGNFELRFGPREDGAS